MTKFTSIYQGLNMSSFVESKQDFLEKGRGKKEPTGTVKMWSDGERYIKVSSGSWEPVKKNPKNFLRDKEFVSWLDSKLKSEFYKPKLLSNSFLETFKDEDTGEVIEVERTVEQVYDLFSAKKRAEVEKRRSFERERRRRQEEIFTQRRQEEWTQILEEERQVLSDMENDPEVLAEGGEGGPATDRYGILLNEIDEKKRRFGELYSSYQDAYQHEGKPVNRESYEHKRSGTNEDLERQIDEDNISRLI